MANIHYLRQFSYSSVAKPVHAYAKVSIAGSGAPTLVSGASMMIESIVRQSAGQYLITLGHKYAALIKADARFISATAPAAPLSFVEADGIASAGTLVLQFLAPDGVTATDPASGEIIMLDILLKDTSLPY